MLEEKNNEFKYAYPVEELDKIIEQMYEGIMPMISDDVMNEVRLRQKQLSMMSSEEDGIDYSDLDGEDTKALLDRHKQLVQKQIENERHKATKDDVIIIKVSEEKKKQIREEMSVSIVRPNPNTVYNKTDEQLYSNAARRETELKLKNLRNCYFNQEDYVNAFKIIIRSIEESLGKYGNGDYPELSYKEAVNKFNKGTIRFRFRELPKLYINHSTMVTDKEVLKGIVFGDIELKNRQEDIRESMRKNAANKRKYKPVDVSYSVTHSGEFDNMMNMHRKGIDTPASTAIRYKSTTYNPTAMPVGSRFYNNGNGGNKALDDSGCIKLHDWMKDGSGKEYFNMTHGRKQSISDMMRYINNQNEGRLGNFVETNAKEFLNSIGHVNGTDCPTYNYMIPNYAQTIANERHEYNVQAAQMEKQLLESISLNSKL